MQMKSRITALVLGASGAALAAGLVLEHGHASGATVKPEPVKPETIACGTPAPARAEAKLEHGMLRGALSAAKLAKNGGGDLHASLSLVTDTVPNGQRAPLDLAFVIDRSGSMEGDRLEHAKSAALGIVAKLDASDHVALVQYDDAAQVVVASLAMDEAGKTKLDRAIQHLEVGGSTNLEAGLQLGRKEVERVYHSGEASRLILLSDGMANVGVVDPKQIAGTARAAADHGVRVTSVGIGLEFNEDLMEAIAEAGRGNYHYVKDAHDLDKTIAGELASVQATVATNVELHLAPSCGGVQIAAVHGYESNRGVTDVVVPMPDLFGGDSRKLLVSLRVPDGTLGTVGALRAELDYTSNGVPHKQSIELGITVTDDRDAAVASIDQVVMAEVMKLEASESMRQAAQQYQAGNAGSAAQTLEAAKQDIAAKRAEYHIAPAKTAAYETGLEDMKAQTAAAPAASPAGMDMIKTSKAKARSMSKY
jgi:Ca-activated chloride channel family protein